jgi:hypothetical protein
MNVDENNYLLFMGACYYPNRGWNNYVNSYPDLESAQKVAKSKLEPFEFDWYQIVDIRTRLIVEEGQVD